MQRYANLILLTALTASTSAPILAGDSQGWYIKPIIGYSNLSDVNAQAQNTPFDSGAIDIQTDSGFVSGLSLGYQYAGPWAAEIGWEYRSNDSSGSVIGGGTFDDGDYAANIFYLNGLYHFPTTSKWQPYLGAGITLVQEIDIDLVANGEELSYSSDGDSGFQVFAGVGRQINDSWLLSAELRVGDLSGIDMESESGADGILSNLDYSTTTLQLGLQYNF